MNIGKFEDLKTLRALETLLLRRRGYVFRMPKPNTPVVFLMSGGLDSVAVVFYLLKVRHLTVYPLYIRWGQRSLSQEERALDYFSRLFSRRFPGQFRPVKKIDVSIPTEDFLVDGKAVSPVPLRNSLFAAQALQYALYLEKTERVKIRTLFVNSMSKDGERCPDARLCAIRAVNVWLCTNMDDYTWQYTSIAIEHTSGMYHDKDYFINFAWRHGLSLKKTWSCFSGGLFQCGACDACNHRRGAYEKSHVNDPTVYRSDMWVVQHAFRFVNRLKHLVGIRI